MIPWHLPALITVLLIFSLWMARPRGRRARIAFNYWIAACVAFVWAVWFAVR